MGSTASRLPGARRTTRWSSLLASPGCSQGPRWATLWERAPSSASQHPVSCEVLEVASHGVRSAERVGCLHLAPCLGPGAADTHTSIEISLLFVSSVERCARRRGGSCGLGCRWCSGLRTQAYGYARHMGGAIGGCESYVFSL